jgi:putative hydrolase of the HAD superfamily
VALDVTSNWDASLEGTLGELGLRAELDGVVSSATSGAAKPDPAIFATALRLAGVAAGEAIHVGDSLEEDIDGARGAGIEPVMLLREGAGPVPAGVRTIRSLAELPGLVGRR